MEEQDRITQDQQDTEFGYVNAELQCVAA